MAFEKINADDTLNQGRIKINNISESVTEIKNRLDGVQEPIAETGTEFYNLSPSDDVSFTSNINVRVCSYKKNQFISPSKLDKTSNTATIHDVVLNSETIRASLDAGKTYGFVGMKPIFLKAGTYNFGASFSVISGNGSGNIGFVYINLCDKDCNETVSQWTSIQLNMNRKSANTIKTLPVDSYVAFNFYVNMNGTITDNLTIEWYDIFINRESVHSGYEKYIGNVIDGTSGIINAFDGMNIISDNQIEIVYVISIDDDDYESFKKQVKINAEDIEELKGGKTYDIVCWGDSLTNGTGSSVNKPLSDKNHDVSYPAVLSRLIGKPVKNYGVGGEPSWMISARSGHNEISVEPFTIPSGVTATRVYLHGQEQDYFWDNTQNKWTYLKDNLSYNIAVDDTYSGVNPCFINGIKGRLTRTLISSGQPDPDTEETVQVSSFAYYFTRSESGQEKTLVCRTPIITDAYLNYDNAIKVIWMGQNDAPLHDGRYVVQGNAQDRARAMCKEKYIVMSLPTGDASGSASREQAFSAMFGSNYLNIRDYIVQNGIAYVNSLGAGITVSESDRALINAGTIPSCLRIDGVHGNYWYYQIVAKAVYDKGKALGYW